MNPRSEALSYWQRLDAEFKRYQAAVTVLPMDQLKVQDDLRRYLCLRCAGFLEQVTLIVLNGYLDQKVSGPARTFAKSHFRKAPNLTVGAFEKLIARFGNDHARQFEEFLTVTRHDALADLLEIRNDVAHGKVFTGQRLQPDRYVTLCEEVYDWLIDTFLGESVEVLDQSGKNVVGYEKSK